MKYLIQILIVTFLLGIASCNENDIYEVEMYKNIFALVSDDNYNILTIEHDLDKPEITGYIAASCGGTHVIKNDINIQMKEDPALFNEYNRNNFDNETQFARLLPTHMYDIPELQFKIPAGERIGRMPLKVRPEGLSPDSIYFISLKVDYFDNYELNPEKADVLYKVSIKNYWASVETATNYRLAGEFDGADIIGTKRLFPLTYNQTRVTVGNTINFTADTAKINTESIILEVEKEQGEKIQKETNYKVTVKPYGRITILPLETTDPYYPNIFFIEDDGYRTYKMFLLHYRYQQEGDETIYEMREELRLEFVEES